MDFFKQLHYSIFRPDFYCEVITYSAKKVMAFLLLMVVVVCIVVSTAHTWYFLDEKTGFPAELSQLCVPMEIINGELNPHRQTPFVLSNRHLINIVSLYFNMPGFGEFPDSFIVVDTSVALSGSAAADPKVIMVLRKTYLEMRPQPSISFKIPYTKLISENSIFNFAPQQISKVAKSHVVSIWGGFCVLEGFRIIPYFLISIFFIAVLGYIFGFVFRIVSLKFLFFFKIAVFSATPLYFGTIMAAIAGVEFIWMWNVLVFLSGIVMLRGTVAIKKSQTPTMPTAEF